MIQTILDIYNKKEIDLLYSEAIDLISLLDDNQLELFYSQNPEFEDIVSGDFKNIIDLKNIISMLVNYITQK